jgi:hydrogenase expression/formation protein HypC
MCLAIPGRVVQIVDDENRLAKVDVSGVLRNVNVGLLDGVVDGDWVLIHVGFAMSKVDEDEAHATLALLQQMGEAYEQELEDLKTSVIE